MKDAVYLVADENGVVRMTKRVPSLYRQEVAVKIAVTIPDGCFRSSVFTASVDVPEDRVIQPHIEVDVAEVEATQP